MKRQLEKDFYCGKCSQRVNKCCEEGNGPCEDYVRFVTRNHRIKILNNQDDGKMTVAECMMLHGRLATLQVLGKRKMASRLAEYEPIVDKYRGLWEKEKLSEEGIQNWIEDRDPIERARIRAVFDFYVKEVGVFLSDNRDELI